MSDLTEAERAYLHSVRTEKNALWAWLDRQPEPVAAVIATRVGFRVLPFVVGEPVEGRFTPKQGREILSAFRYLSLGRLSTRRPGLALDAVATLLNSFAYAKGTSAMGAVQEASRAAPSPSAFISRADAAKASASRAAQAAMFSATSPAGAPWGAIAADRAWIEAGRGSIDLLDEPMWLDPGGPGAVPEPQASRWDAMRAALENEDGSWRVWTAWYRDRLRGTPAPPDEVEHLRLTLVPGARARVEDPSADGLRRWMADIEANRGLLKSSPRRANRVAVELLGGLDGSR